MKRIVLLSIIICYNLAVFSQATDIVVDCQTPGWLSSKINYGDQQTVRNLKVTGYINSDDMKFIGELISSHNLNEKVDLSDVNIINNTLGSNCFGISVYGENTLKCLSLPKTVENLESILPYNVYSNGSKLALQIDTLYFNCNTKYLNSGMFGAHQYDEMPHHIIIGEKIDSIPNDAFFEKKGINSIKMPQGMKYIGSKAFSQTNQYVEETNFNELKKLKYLGLGAFPGYEPDTIIVPKSLDNPFYLFAFAHKDNQHIFIDDNIKTISGYALGTGGKWTTSYCTEKLIFHINNETPPSLINFRSPILGTPTIYVPKGTKQAYLNSDWADANIIEVSPELTLNISSSGNGFVLYNGTSIREETKAISVEKGTSASISFNPDNGYRIKCVKINNTDVTSEVSNNQYTINNINGDISIEVEFEKAPLLISFADANVKAICVSNWDKDGDGEISEDEAADVTDIGTAFKNNKNITSFNELQYFIGLTSIGDNAFSQCSGLTSITIPNSVTSIGSFAFSNCSYLKEVKSEIINPYNIENEVFRNISSEALLYVPVGTKEKYQAYEGWTINFKEIIESTTGETFYTLSIKATGNGSASYNESTIKNQTSTFTITEGSSATITFTPDDGCCIASVKLNGTDITQSVTNNQYALSNITCDNILEVTFSASSSDIDITKYISVSSAGGSVTQTNNLINSGSQLNWRFSNNSEYSVTLKSLQLIDGQTGSEGNIMSVNAEVEAGKSVTYSTTIGASGIHTPVTCRYRYEFDGNEYSADAVYPIPLTLTIKATGGGYAKYSGTTIRDDSKSFTIEQLSSVTVTFTPDDGYRIKSVMVDGKNKTSSLSANSYSENFIMSSKTIEVEFEAIPPTYALNITTSGNGSVTYNNNAVRNTTKSFSVEGGSSVSLSFKADTGNKIKSVKLNNVDITSEIKDNNYSINDIRSDHNLEVEFEAITHTLTINATGNGTATYNDTSVRDKSSSFTVNEGTSATITFAPDTGYRIASVKLDDTDVTSNVVDNKYTISNITADTTLTVTFEAIPPTTYSLTIKATGNGTATYNDTSVREKTQTFTVNEGTSATITFTPDAGYRIASVMVNNTDVTANVSNSQYTISNITANTNLSVTFEAIPPTTYSLTIKATGNGTATYNDTSVRDKSSSFTVNEGTSATITFTPDTGYQIASVKLNDTDVTSNVADSKYTISNITADTTLTVTFEAIPPTTYSLTIKATGNGTATYNDTSVRDKSSSFTVNEGTSATITFTPDTGYQIASVKLNDTDVTSNVADSKYTISNITTNTTLAVTFEAIPPTTYTLSISATGNGSATYDGTEVRGKTSSFSVVEGTNAVLKFSADEENRLKSVIVNNQDVTSIIVNNQYTISNITADTNVEVAFEAIPDYTLNIVVSGNGSATYNETTIRNQSQNFILQEGSSATVSFTPDEGYRIKSVNVNNADVTSQVVNGQITISNITQDINVEVSFEAIPVTTYSLTITATGNGAVTYEEQSIRGGTSTFTVVEGAYATVQITADEGYRLKQVTLDGKDVTADVSNGQYTTTKIMANTTLAVEFEAIPTFSLSIKSSAFGSVKYGDAVITNGTETFTVIEGAQAVLTFMPDGNGRLERITLNGNDITSQLVNGQYTISDIRADQNVEAEYVEDITKVTDAGVAYTVTSYDEGTVIVAAGNYGQVLTVPVSFTAKGKTWTVTGIEDDALVNATELATIIWEPEVPVTAQVSNPNLLLYVKKDEYAPTTIQNVVANDVADNIVLVEAESGNNFYCPKPFTAKRISYEHNYSMISGYKDCQGWETLVLPFDVTMTINTKGTELVPYSTWKYGSNQRPFWLYQLTNEGWKAADSIKANVPYIISMPNNEMYESSYNQTGNIQFIGTNVEVKASDKPETVQYGNKHLVANYQNQAASSDIYALNVSNDWHQNTATEKEGSTFIRSLRAVHPFEAYMTMEGSNAPWAIPIFDNATDVRWLMEEVRGTMAEDAWYDLQGRKLQGEPAKNGLYINKGKKIRK